MNKWIRYVDRSFSSIRASISYFMNINTPDITDKSSSNLLMIIVDMFAGVAEMLNYYIDITARELFLPTARRFTSILKIANQANYQGKAKTAAYCNVTFTAKDSSSETISSPSDITIPKGTLLTDTQNSRWVSQKAQVIRTGYTNVQVDVRQVSAEVTETLGTSDGSIDQAFLLPGSYRHGSISIIIDSIAWSLESVLGFSLPTDKHFTVIMGQDGANYLQFGDGTNGAVPGAGLAIVGTYETTEGPTGNAEEDTITTILSTLTHVGIDHFEVTNPLVATGGKEIEGMEEIRRAIPLSLRTLSRGVTRQDYEDLAVLHEDIRAARASFGCGTGVELYLVTHGGGLITTTLLDEVKNAVFSQGMMNIPVTTYPSGESRIFGSASVKAKYRIPNETLLTNIRTALTELYNPYTSTINQDVRLSDIISAIDQAEGVDYLNLDYIYAMPYLRPSSTDYLLDYTIEVLVGSINRTYWTLLYDPATDGAQPFMILKDGTFLAKLGANESVTGVASILSMNIGALPGSITQGDSWSFTVYPYNSDIELDDLSIPIIEPNDFIINIEQTFV